MLNVELPEEANNINWDTKKVVFVVVCVVFLTVEIVGISYIEAEIAELKTELRELQRIYHEQH